MKTAAEIQVLITAEQDALRTNSPVNQRHDFLVVEHRLDDLKTKLDKLARRAAKLGLEPITYTVGDYIEESCTRNEAKFIVRKYALHIEGVMPKLNGWMFVATLQHLDGGDNIIRNITDMVVPVEYRTALPRCNHCNTLRRRIDTYLLFHSETNTWKQVGSNCIQDFLGSVEAEVMARQAEYLWEALEAAGGGEDFDDGCNVKPYYSVANILGLTILCIEKFGWMSRSKAKDSVTGQIATAEIVGRNLWDKPEYLKLSGFLLEGKADEQMVQKILEWAQNISDTTVEKNDYLYNIRIIARVSSIEKRLLGYACSIVSAYQREIQRQVEQENLAKLGKLSNFVGQVGDKLTDLNITVLSMRDFDSDFGKSTLVTMVADNGNRFKWWTSTGGLDIKDGDTYSRVQVGQKVCIKGTVKKHETYQDIKETVLTRCSQYIAKPAKVKKTKTA